MRSSVVACCIISLYLCVPYVFVFVHNSRLPFYNGIKM